jgi:molybdopterin-guanine dinucleotide biosynthesis protein A
VAALYGRRIADKSCASTMSLGSNFSAVLLAAGHSTRMGREKALLEVDGAPLWRRQRDLLVAAGAAEVYVSVRPEQAWAREGKFAGLLFDDLPNAGPISGITAALERTTRGHVLVLAVDLPQMNAEWLRRLTTEATPGVGAVGRRENFFEPLAAIYPREMMPLFWEAVAGAQYALQPVLARAEQAGQLRVKQIGAAEAAWFENWNEPGR